MLIYHQLFTDSSYRQLLVTKTIMWTNMLCALIAITEHTEFCLFVGDINSHNLGSYHVQAW